MAETDLNFDFIVVGGGSAGCVLANRLSADPTNRVLLLEAGGSGRDPSYDLPFIAGKLFELERNNWAFRSQPQENLNGRSMYFPRGKMLGGSFIFNGAQYIRGNRSDFDHWRQLGNAGWSYDDVLPYFMKSESYEGGKNAYHNDRGGLPVGKPPTVSPLTDSYLVACRQAGYRLNSDFNGPEQEGFGIYDFNIRGGRRVTTAKAFLRPAMNRPNLRVIVDALVARVVIEDGLAKGVEFFKNGGVRRAWPRARLSCRQVRSTRRSCLCCPVSAMRRISNRMASRWSTTSGASAGTCRITLIRPSPMRPRNRYHSPRHCAGTR